MKGPQLHLRLYSRGTRKYHWLIIENCGDEEISVKEVMAFKRVVEETKSREVDLHGPAIP
jgi:hypothetical protein